MQGRIYFLAIKCQKIYNGPEGEIVRFTHSSHCSEPSFGRRVLTATERSRAVARTGRSFHLGNLWRRGGDCAFHAFLTLFGTVLRTSCPDGHRTLAGCRPYRSFFSSREFMAERGRLCVSRIPHVVRNRPSDVVS